jgi:membrane-bound metal-dependent hydrolase YbcI (DUF457 family)
MNYKSKSLAPDTSHYDDCRGLMHTIVRNRKARFIITCIFCLLSFIINTTAIFFVSAVIALISTAFLAAVCSLAMPQFLKSMKTLIALMLVVTVGTLFSLIQPGIGIALLLLYATQIYENKREEWLSQQEGYPHFEQYITIQEYGMEEYDPTYSTDEKRNNGEMPDVVGGEEDAFNIHAAQKTEIAPLPEPASLQNTAAPELASMGNSAAPVAAPIVPPTQDTASILSKSAVPETPAKPKKKRRSRAWEKYAKEEAAAQVPDVSDVPDVAPVDFDIPKDFPTTNWDIPDPVMDTSSITSSFPDIAGDIADLPDIPDIPQI